MDQWGGGYSDILIHTLAPAIFFLGGGGRVRKINIFWGMNILWIFLLVRGDRDSRANLMPIYSDLYQIKF